MQNLRHVSLLTSGQDQLLTIPSEFALSATEVMLRTRRRYRITQDLRLNHARSERQRLIIKPIPANSLLALLTTL